MLNHKNFIHIDSVMRLVTTMVISVVVALYILAGSFIYVIIEKENGFLRDKIENSFQIEHKHDVDVVREYSFWNEAYHNLHLSKNADWIKLNIYNYIFDVYDYEWIAIKSENGIDLKAKKEFSPVSNKTLKNLKLKKTSTSSKFGIGKHFKVHDTLYKIIALPFFDEETKEEQKEMLIFAIRINDQYLDKIVKKYELPKLNFSSGTVAEDRLLIKGDYNKYYGSIYWNYKSSTENFAPYIIVFGLIISAIFIFIIRKVLFKTLQDSAKYGEALYDAATKDYLTKIANRRYFFDNAEKELSLLNIEGRKAGLLVLDLDYFKKINDTYGHNIGDKALIYFSNICKDILRKDDLIGRLGGEEFAIFLPDSDINSCYSVANRIHKRLKEKPIRIDKKQNFNLSVSIGISVNTMDNNTLDDLVQNADKALYESKNKGRNQTTVAN